MTNIRVTKALGQYLHYPFSPDDVLCGARWFVVNKIFTLFLCINYVLPGSDNI